MDEGRGCMDTVSQHQHQINVKTKQKQSSIGFGLCWMYSAVAVLEIRIRQRSKTFMRMMQGEAKGQFILVFHSLKVFTNKIDLSIFTSIKTHENYHQPLVIIIHECCVYCKESRASSPQHFCDRTILFPSSTHPSPW